MKKYSLEWLSTQKKLTRATKPKPFPGKYPTRIAYFAKLTNGKQRAYIGKPSRPALKKLREYVDSYTLREFAAVEFDRNGIIATDRSLNPVIRGKFAAASIRLVYHPFDNLRFFPVDGTWEIVDKLRPRQFQLIACPQNMITWEPGIQADRLIFRNYNNT